MKSSALYDSDPKVFRKFKVKDTLFVHYNCPQQDKILELYSDHNQFLFTLSGKKIFHHGDDTFLATRDTTFFLKRCAFLQELPPDYSGFEVLVFYPEDDFLRIIFDELRPYLPLNGLPGISDKMFMQVVIDEQARASYQSFIPYFDNGNEIPESIIEAKFKELIFNILIHPANRQVLAYMKGIADDVLTPVWHVMESSYMRHLSIAEYARLSNRSLAKFKRDFYTHYHTTPGKWLIERRLKRAGQMLGTSQLSIGEVAYLSGFQNVSHFSKSFKDKYGMPPVAYRDSLN